LGKVHSDEIVAVILAGGLGTRIKHLLPNLPKPMAPVRGRPCIEWLVRYLAAQGIRRILISTGHLAEVIERHFALAPVNGVKVLCIPETRPLGTGGGFLHAVRASGEVAAGWLVLNGDTFALADLAQATATLDNKTMAGAVFARAVADTSRYGSLVTDASGNLVRFEEKRPGEGLISAGVYLFRDELVRTFANHIPLSLERDVFPALTSAGALIKVLPMDTPFLDIGTPETLPAADSFIRDNLAWFGPAPL
jgi:D-glycero-alpha-D-manno-heptose 1-phosphate guanylyltransferase